MENIDNIMQLCRLCLVKEQVNTPIFGQNNDLEEISAKIRSCLPVKVSPDDSLPKKICDGCSYKLDLLYVFRNTSINSEKQLYQWLEQAGITKTTAATATTMSTPSITATTNPTTPAIPSTDPIIPTIPATNTTALDNIVNDAITKSEISVKQEKSDSTAGSELSAETQEYLLQQQKLPYQESFGDFNTETNSAEPEEPARKKLRRAAASKPPIKDNESDPDMPPTKAEDDSDEDMDDMGDGGMDDDDDDDEEEEEDGLDHPEFVDVPSTSAEEQPGPSGVNKDPIAAPSHSSPVIHTCNICSKIFPNRQEFVKHHLHQYGETFDCCKCGSKFKTTSELYAHLEIHKTNIIIEDESNSEYVEEIVLNYENEEVVEVAEDNSELVYILDDTQCVNEVVIEEETDAATAAITEKDHLDNVTIVKLEHGYVIPDDDDTVINGKQKSVTVKTQPSTSKVQYVNPPKPSSRLSQPKRHVVPDFSSPNYIYVDANDEIDIPHYKCLRCEQIFINKFVFFRHIEKGKCYINNCDVCSATFMKNSEFYYHYVVEHTDRAICNFCFRTFMYEKNVKEHMLRHLDQFRHRCDECNKGFYTVREYRNHYKNRHMGIRHTCDYCNRSFADEYYFRRHIATHEQTNIVVQ